MSPRVHQSGTLLLCRIISLLALAYRVTSANCYSPDRSPVPVDIPCETTGGDTACCSSGAFCMTNGYCLDKMIVTRGTCTDITWTTPNCALECKNGSPNSFLFASKTKTDVLFSKWGSAVERDWHRAAPTPGLVTTTAVSKAISPCRSAT